jgi:alcohol dehydrogenase
MKIRAAVLHEMGLPRPYGESRPLKIEEVELDPPGDGEVLVKIHAAGLCHSDLSVIDGNRPRPMPMAIGHEAAGEVVEVGHGVHDVAPGDHVVFVFVPSCGHCRPCASGRPALCEPAAAANGAGTLISGARRIKLNGKEINHHLGVSAFADYAVVSRYSFVKIEKDIPFDIAALFGCAVITGVGAVVNTSQIHPGSTVAVIGLGGVGLNALLGARVAGARQIVAIDTRDDKLEFARQLGATDAFNAKDENIVARVKEATGGGVEYAFEMAGSAAALELAWNITGRGGETVSAGLPHPSQRLSIPPVQLVAEERTLRGSYLGSCVPVRDIPNFVQLYRAGQLPVDRLMTEKIRLDEINEAFERLAEGKSVRTVMVP